MKIKMRSSLKYVAIISMILVVSIAVISHISKGDVSDDYQFSKKPGGFAEFFKTISIPIGEEESGYQPGYRFLELKKLEKNKSFLKSSFSDTLVWQSRGPFNVAGRTRTILVDPDDATRRTWYAGTAGGGIWKTSDAGLTWADLTPELPNLSTVSLCMAASNHDVMFAGTGEGFGGIGMITGDGIYKTENRGATWNRIESTNHPDFQYINDILVAPGDENVLLVATNTGIYHTLNSGASWDTVYTSGMRVQNLYQNPMNPASIYAGVNSVGMIKSVDGGLNWEVKNTGVENVSRFSVVGSPVDTSYIYALSEMKNGEMAVYFSNNDGDSWIRNSEDDNFFNFLGAQGWYNNTIAADPFIKEKVFIGGVYVGAFTFESGIGQSDPKILSVDTVNTSSFLSFVNFGGSFMGGGMSSGLDEEATVSASDFVSVELRFGNGLSQKAHRFLVPEGEGAGVSFENYSYADYVDVPFQAWDVKNNRQLMVSFRDQERDGFFNLIQRDDSNDLTGREYIFVQAIEYDANFPNVSIAKAGGHYEKMLYFFWPTLSDSAVWEPASLPESSINIEYGTYPVQLAATKALSSVKINTNLHVDHHKLIVLPGDSENSERMIISANDGGVAVSYNSGSTWEQLSKGIYSTQFYGVAKKYGEDVFIGGMQDNGTWRSPKTRIATDKLDYEFMLGGDGFETLWHPSKKKEIIASIYNNQFYKSSDGGDTWSRATNGLGAAGPFISKLSNSILNPGIVYTIDAAGVYRHTTFCNPAVSWQLTGIEEGLDFYGTATSAIDVEASDSDPSIVWAGQGMLKDPQLDIFISEDYGKSFTPVSQYDEIEMGFISAIETHPKDPSTAYLLFSYQGLPKILRTEDKGGSWEDITGFGTDSVSKNGFPDVMVLSLLVMPHDPNVIWAGTEIGIVETIDNGESWHLLGGEFPKVSVYQMHYQDDQIILATHGRGIWTASNKVVSVKSYERVPFDVKIYPNPVKSDMFVELNDALPGPLSIRVLSVSGQVMYEEERNISIENELIHLNMSDLTPGNYLIYLANGKRTYSERIVVL